MATIGGAVLVDRRPELEVLASTYAEVRSERPQTVLISGPAGIGKTALLRRFTESLDAEARLLHATGDQAETRLAFGLLQQLVLGLDLPIGELLADVVGGRRLAPDPLAVGVALLAAVGEREERGPVVIAVDDAPWADRPSLEALTFALRRLRADHVMALLTLRSGDEPGLPAGLLRLAERPTGTRLRLAGLGPDELRDLGSVSGVGELSPLASRRLHEYTEGNPLYAISLLREVGPEALRGPGPVPAPPTLSALLLARLASCSEDAVDLVQAASVLGMESPLELVALVADVDDPLPALEEAVDAGLLRVDRRDPRRLAFVHPLVQAAVYGDIGPARRATLHARAAGVLTGDAVLDHRVRATGPVDEALAEELGTRAAEEAERGDHRAAARHLLAAARLHPMAKVRSTYLLRAATSMLVANDYAGVAAIEGEIHALQPSPWRDLILGNLALGQGRLADATGLLEAALPVADPDAEPGLVAMIAFILGECRILSAGRGQETADLGRLALRLAPPGSPARLSWVAVLLGTAVAGRPREAVRLAPPVEQLGAGVEALGLRLGRAIVLTFLDDLDAARAELEAIERPLVHAGPGHLSGPVLFHQAAIEFKAGAWDDALAYAHLGLSIAGDTDDLLALGFHHTILGSVHSLRGEWEAAEQHIAAARTRAEASGARAHLVYASLAAARLPLARGDPDGVLAALAPLVEMASEDGVREHGVVPWRDLRADALVGRGRLDEAEAVVDELERHAQERDLGSAFAAAARVRGNLEAARGDPARAEAAFEAGLEHARRIGMPFLSASLALDLGAFLRRLGRRREAVARLEEAASAFRSLGAEPFLERCERELATTGRRRARRGTAHLAITPQEVAVARLVGRGFSNREVAAELVVSVKTVEYHLSNLYAKVGVRSRTQLVARLAGTDGPIGLALAATRGTPSQASAPSQMTRDSPGASAPDGR